MKQKKKFKDTKIGGFLNTFKDVIPNVAGIGVKIATGNISGAIDDIKNGLHGNPEAAEARKEFERMQLEFELEFEKIELAESQEVTKRWESDNQSDNKLTKIVRPITLLYMLALLTIIILCGLYGKELPESYVLFIFPLIGSVILAYFGVRGYEKIKKIAISKNK